MVRAMRWFPAVALSACGGGGGGGDGDGDGTATGTPTGTGGSGGPPAIVVRPTEFDFGVLTVGQTSEDFITVLNEGGSRLTVDRVEIEGGAFVLVDPTADAAFGVSPGSLNYVDILYTSTGGDDTGVMTIHSDDPVNPTVTVALRGQGLLPDLQITPAMHDFGEVPIPCGGEVELTLTNVGTSILDISTIDFASNGLLVLDPTSLPRLPIQLSPGFDEVLRVSFVSGEEPASDTATLTVGSNDPDGDQVATVSADVVWLGERTETFDAPKRPSVDIAFLIDTSCSMAGDNTDDIELGIPDLLDQLSQVSDWQIIEVTKRGGCSNVGILTEADTDAEQLLIDHAFDGDNYLTHEALLELAAQSLSRTGPGDCLDGFLRPASALHILIASDEPEQSQRPASHWVDEYLGYVAHPSMLTVSGVLDLSHCGEGAAGYLQAVDLTGGATLDICEPLWGAQMTVIAEAMARIPPTYILSGKPVGSSIVVKIDGTPTTQFTYDLDSNAILVLDPLWTQGAVISVTYQELGVCP